jgi:hypothetical protein
MRYRTAKEMAKSDRMAGRGLEIRVLLLDFSGSLKLVIFDVLLELGHKRCQGRKKNAIPLIKTIAHK